MKMNKKKIWIWILWSGFAVLTLPLLLLGVYTAWYEYTFYKEYKSVKNVKLLHIYNREYNRFEIDLPVKFVPNEHDSGTVQMLLVQTENKKPFIISRLEDGNIQLSPLYLTKFLNWKYLHAVCYNITDPAAEEKVRKLLDVYCKDED